MRFNGITIKDLFSYQGEVTFDFNDSNNPISLIIGENGFGKTSFINSVKIALHGVTKDLISMGELVLSKQDYIVGNRNKNFSGVLNRVSKLNGANKASVKIKVDDSGESFYIYREYIVGNNTYNENLSVYDEDDNLIYSDIEAQDFINYKISPTLAKFFFFDGEKIQTIADFSKDEFRQMLEDVLELDIYDQLITDSTSVIKKINKSELDAKLQEYVSQKEKELEEIDLKLGTLSNELEEERLELNQLLTDQKDLDRALSKLKSKHKKPLETAKAELLKYEEEKEEYQRKFKEISYMQLPLLLNKKLKQSVEKDIETNYKGNVTISQNIINLKKKEFLSHIGTEQKESIESIFDKVFNSDENRQSVVFADPEKIEHQYNTFKDVDFPELVNNLIYTKDKIVQTQNEIYHLEQSHQNDQKEYQKEFERVKVLAESIGQRKAKVEALESQIDTLEYEKREVEKEIGRSTIKEYKNSLAKLKVKSLESTIEVAKQMKIKIKEDKKEILESSINVKFNLLKKDGYEADSIQLDNDFNINVYDKDMNPMDILSSSSGQKQIIATALIWGISEYISEDIPMIIDTPLGRLDEKNQSLILNQFYPNASKQVLILPTPSELRHEGFKELQGEISQIFTLANKGSATTMQEKNIAEFFDGRYTK